jgi:TolB-like protein
MVSPGDSFARLKSGIGDRYSLERELGRGGMATVYLARDLRHGREVAVKALQPELAHAIGPERFLQEIEIAARLSHPNILPLHDSGESDGLLYYVMPFVEGATLRHRLTRERQLGLDEAVQIARNVADALTYAHSHVVHRDIKPENILRTLRPTIPPGVERVVEKALAKVPADRFATADQFARQLGNASTAQAVAADARRARTVRVRMHDALISELAQAGVPVIARTSVMRYQHTTKPARDIAGELNVDAVVEASVSRSGDSVYIRAHLVDGGTEQTLWAGSYGSDLRNVPDLHRQMTRAIVGQIRVVLTPQAELRLKTAAPVHPEAYEAYLKGLFHWKRATLQDLETAEQYFDFALKKDPNYALAHAGIA